MRAWPLFLCAGLLFSAGLARDSLDRWVDQTVLPPTLAETSVEVRDRDGHLLRVFPVEDGRWRLTPGAVDPGYVDMLIRYEDKRFHQHAGVDPLALGRAVAQAVRHGRSVSGGSTLTMQVARLLENSGTGSWRGKLRQVRLAMALEQHLTKDQILDLYLLHAPFGGNLEGVRAATLGWFGKEPRRLTPSEAALLVALPQSPESRRPDRHMDAARAARDRVLARMTHLDAETVAVAAAAALPRRMTPFPRRAAHEADHIRRTAPDRQVHALTLDGALQARLEKLARAAADRIGQRVSVAIIVADYRSGDILASIGSPDYADTARRQGFVDMTRAVRSPGSTLKPLIYGMAFDQGLAHPQTVIHDGPVQYNGYAPQNFDGEFRGDLRIRDALQQSLNTPVVQLTRELGPSRVMNALENAGAAPKLPGGKPGLAIALGGVGVTLRDLVQLYAVMAGSGQAPLLRAEGETDPGLSRRIMSDVAAWQVMDTLRGLAPPPGAPANTLAYKTGTSYGHRDTWAVGFDGAHVAGIWIGRPDGTPVPGAFGGDLAAPLLFDVFGHLKPEFDRMPPPPPATLIVNSAELPRPLQRFRPRDALQAPPENAPDLFFPPSGARLALADGTITLKLRGGQTPFAVLADGKPVATGLRRREFELPSPGRGFATFVVIDAAGQSDRVTVEVD
ncbi:MAG: penicillin-binding protein 1C [Paracoccaceae bacterium]